MKRVAVTGLGCVTPVGNDVKSYWDSLIAGRHGIGFITKFDASDRKVRIAAEVKGFEPERYMEKGDIRKSDLFTQYAIAAAAQAVEESGVASTVDAERFGVYMGSGIGGIDTFMTEHKKLLEKGPNRVSPFFIPMMIVNMASAHIAMRCGAMGPNMPVVSACATSTNAIGEAFRTIKHGYADVVVAGGSEAAVNPLAISGFTNCMALCATNDVDNASMPFDARRSGFVMGEGAGAVVLEEYEHAKARGAHIYCEIAGYGNTNDAYHITAPHPEAVGGAKMIELAFREAGISSFEKLYINPHGTSTPLNDKTETRAIKMALGDAAYDAAVSSTKGATGHMLGAAGAVEAIAAILALHTGVVPPTVGYQQPDPECDLDYVPGQKRHMDIDKAISMSLGFGGHNAGVVFKKTE